MLADPCRLGGRSRRGLVLLLRNLLELVLHGGQLAAQRLHLAQHVVCLELGRLHLLLQPRVGLLRRLRLLLRLQRIGRCLLARLAQLLLQLFHHLARRGEVVLQLLVVLLQRAGARGRARVLALGRLAARAERVALAAQLVARRLELLYVGLERHRRRVLDGRGGGRRRLLLRRLRRRLLRRRLLRRRLLRRRLLVRAQHLDLRLSGLLLELSDPVRRLAELPAVRVGPLRRLLQLRQGVGARLLELGDAACQPLRLLGARR